MPASDKDSVAKLVAGLGVYICNECVELCSLIIAEDPAPAGSAAGMSSPTTRCSRTLVTQEPEPSSAPRVRGWDEQPDDALLANLGRLQAVVSQVDAALHNHVGMLRDRGVSWTRVGEALGVSKQAAWERFSGED